MSRKRKSSSFIGSAVRRLVIPLLVVWSLLTIAKRIMGREAEETTPDDTDESEPEA